MMKIVWANTKKQETLENCQNTDSVVGTIWSTMDPTKVRTRHFSRRIVLHFPGICLRFRPKVLSQKGTVLPPISTTEKPRTAFVVREDNHRLIPHIVLFITDKVRPTCEPKMSTSRLTCFLHLKAPQILTANFIVSSPPVKKLSLCSELGHVFFCHLTTHFLLSCSTDYPSPSPNVVLLCCCSVTTATPFLLLLLSSVFFAVGSRDVLCLSKHCFAFLG